MTIAITVVTTAGEMTPEEFAAWRETNAFIDEGGNWSDDWKEFTAALCAGREVEINHAMFDRWLNILPPAFMTRTVEYTAFNDEGPFTQRVDFAFREGDEPPTLFWQRGERFFCRRTISGKLLGGRSWDYKEGREKGYV